MKRRSNVKSTGSSSKRANADPVGYGRKEPYGLVWYLTSHTTGVVKKDDLPANIKVGGLFDAPNPVDWTEPNDGKKYKAKLIAVGYAIDYLYSIPVKEDDGSIITIVQDDAAPLAKSKYAIFKEQKELMNATIKEVNEKVMRLPPLFPHGANKENLDPMGYNTSETSPDTSTNEPTSLGFPSAVNELLVSEESQQQLLPISNKANIEKSNSTGLTQASSLQTEASPGTSDIDFTTILSTSSPVVESTDKENNCTIGGCKMSCPMMALMKSASPEKIKFLQAFAGTVLSHCHMMSNEALSTAPPSGNANATPSTPQYPAIIGNVSNVNSNSQRAAMPASGNANATPSTPQYPAIIGNVSNVNSNSQRAAMPALHCTVAEGKYPLVENIPIYLTKGELMNIPWVVPRPPNASRGQRKPIEKPDALYPRAMVQYLLKLLVNNTDMLKGWTGNTIPDLLFNAVKSYINYRLDPLHKIGDSTLTVHYRFHKITQT